MNKQLLTLTVICLGIVAIIGCDQSPGGDSESTQGVSSSSSQSMDDSGDYARSFELHGASWSEALPSNTRFAVTCVENHTEKNLRWRGMPCNEGTEDYPLSTERPAWDELTEGERLLLGRHEASDRPGLLDPLRKHRRAAAKFAHEYGRAPNSLKELYPGAWKRSLADFEGADLDQETWLKYALYFDPIQGDLLEINPDEVEPGTIEFKTVDNKRLRRYALAGLGSEYDELDWENADATVIYYRFYGKDARIITEGIYGYWPAFEQAAAERREERFGSS